MSHAILLPNRSAERGFCGIQVIQNKRIGYGLEELIGDYLALLGKRFG
jgi:hypothetical protein